MMFRLLLALLIALCTVQSARGATIEGRIVGIIDGDTITLLDAEHQMHKIRLDGVDAPENGQPFGSASKRSLSDMVFDCDAVAECA